MEKPTFLPHPTLQSNGTAFAVQTPHFGIKKGTAFAVPFLVEMPVTQVE